MSGQVNNVSVVCSVGGRSCHTSSAANVAEALDQVADFCEGNLSSWDVRGGRDLDVAIYQGNQMVISSTPHWGGDLTYLQEFDC